jgi:3,4-dihydroxy 2-butanone 4-phosphate synthase / GTP cyclohydrolase II
MTSLDAPAMGPDAGSPADLAARALRAGEPVLVAGIDGRGALVAAAASRIHAETLTTISALGGDLTMVAVDAEHAQRAGLTALPVVTRAREGLRPALPVDALARLGEAGSPAGRVRTIRALADPACQAEALTSPGHVPTAIADDSGGAAPGLALELTRLADCGSAVVICPVVDADGRQRSLTDARQVPALAALACAPALELRSRTVARELEHSGVECSLPTTLGSFRAVALTHSGGQTALALVHGDPGRDPDRTLVHTHLACLLGDTFGSMLCDCRERLERATREIVAAGSGVVVYLRATDADPFSCPAGRRVDPSLALGVLSRAGLAGAALAA